MSKNKEKDKEEWEWDKERVGTAILVAIIIIGAAWFVMDSYTPKEPRNVMYTLVEDKASVPNIRDPILWYRDEVHEGEDRINRFEEKWRKKEKNNG